MKKVGFIGSFICLVIGAVALMGMGILREIMPKLGYMVFQASSAGSYSPTSYQMGFTLPSIVAWALIGFGVLFGAYCFITDRA